ncbi:ras-related protein Rab-17 [Rhinolophus sinicus]|uniref:ras-related protein Rab-17 n=1 Tax=Rhinolophus sinicus TaxID=89399 RepID=UPI003D7A42FE
MAQANGAPQPGAAPSQLCVFKLVLLGSGSVGKSSLALRFVKDDFKSILPTVGCKDSFCRAQQWLKDLEKEFLPGEVVVMLVGNKVDLGEKREVTFEDGKEFAERQNLLFMETSAKLNHQVTEAFSAIARELLQREERKEGPMPPQGDARLALGRGPAGQAKCCAH